MTPCLACGFSRVEQSNTHGLFDGLPLTSLSKRGLARMIRDTFETNPGLSQLFMSKMLERARFVGLSEDLIDFETHLDMKGTYQDNMRIFYREYPQLSRNSDYLRIKCMRPLTGAALEQSWRSFERNNGHDITEQTRTPTEPPPTTELVITYTIGGAPEISGKEAPKPPEPISTKTMTPRTESNPAASTYRELVKSILDHVTVLTGEKATRMILHQIEREMTRTTFNYSRDQNPPHHLTEALDDILHRRRTP